MYRIVWHSKITKAKGWGEFVFDSIAEAMDVAEAADREFPDIVHEVQGE